MPSLQQLLFRGGSPNLTTIPTFAPTVNAPGASTAAPGNIGTNPSFTPAPAFFQRGFKETTNRLVENILPFVQRAGAETLPVAFGNLADIIASRGRTDPTLLNREIARIGIDTDALVRNIQGRAAATGSTGSGVFQALQTAVEQSGQERAAQLEAQERRLADERMRQDLQLVLAMILDPALAGLGARTNIATARAGRQSGSSTLAALAGLAQLGGSVASAVGTGGATAPLLLGPTPS